MLFRSEAFFTTGRFQSEVLPKIRAIGARVSIDDFGVGYSSLAALADITADELKIDRSFITDIDKRPRSQIVLKAIESLGVRRIQHGVRAIEEFVHGELPEIPAALSDPHARDLDKAFKEVKGEPLPFPFGYHWKGQESGLILATRP